MDRFRVILVGFILLIAMFLFYKLLQRKRVLLEGASEFTYDMNAMRTLHSPEILLPSYKVLKIANRPGTVQSTATNTYNTNKTRLVTLNAYLASALAQQKPFDTLKMPTKKTAAELRIPNGNRQNTQLWKDYDKRVLDSSAAYNAAMSAYNVKKAELTKLQDNASSLTTQIRNLQSDISKYECSIAGNQGEYNTYNDNNDSDTYRNYRLKDLFIKASYNSAFTGKSMNRDMVELVLRRGCRYIDFEVTKTEGALYVAELRLIDVLGIINKSMFGTDPLFINLRLSSDDIVPEDLNGLLSNDLLYSGRAIDETTRISEVSGKCILITDREINGSHMVSNCKSDAMCAYRYSEISQFQSVRESTKLTVVNPDDERSGMLGYVLSPSDVDTKYLVANYLVNVIPFRFYNKSAEFDFYERIFNDKNCTIVPLKTMDADTMEAISTAADKIL